MAQFASDDFTGTNGTELSAHDASWVRHPTSVLASILAHGRIRGDGADASLYYHSGIPVSADYSVSADIHKASDEEYGAGVLARVDASSATFYMARWHTSYHPDRVQLYKFVGGVATLLHETDDDLTLGASARIRLECIGSTISVYLRGSTAASISVTDDSIPAAGYAGIRMGYAGCTPASDTACLHLDNFGAADVVTHLDLAPAGAIQATHNPAAPIAQNHALAVAGSVQAAMGGTAVIFRGLTLAGTPSVQPGASLAEAITQVHILAGVGTIQAALSSALAVESAPAGTLQISVSVQPSSSIAVAITQVHVLKAAHAMGSDASGAGAIRLGTGALAVMPCVQAGRCDALPISQIGVIQEPAAPGGAVIRGKKPGVPGGTPEWLKTTLEILTGRRGNRIEIPRFQHLSFSDTPTRMECEALYRYTNTVRQAVEDIVTRMDN